MLGAENCRGEYIGSQFSDQTRCTRIRRFRLSTDFFTERNPGGLHVHWGSQQPYPPQNPQE
jgi:hypothetical protein